jgi:hypothetical protein
MAMWVTTPLVAEVVLLVSVLLDDIAALRDDVLSDEVVARATVRR